ncbi:Ig-like domain-containing protein [Enterococcus sp. BWR-S5]|uniref:Ig-like domain-containing protein n=1 Tax=Enterococcus sp. BWR-S5 TaxID=2787714 RepID=UPI001921388B|nr:Ig-like domain-containing protein [Enterococcus sp. BWR-S5]MBL1224003.1 Ig-like domain-containing protein [Enterococcus sp. BWR-S5]
MKKKLFFGVLLSSLFTSLAFGNSVQVHATFPNDTEKGLISVQEHDAIKAFSPVETQAVSKWDPQQNLLVVLVEFEDVALSSDEEDWYNKFFGDEKSLKAYYQEQTGGFINITPANETYGKNNGIVKVKVNQKHPNAGQSVSVWPTMENVLNQADSYINFAEYDTKPGITNAVTQDELHVMAIFAGKELSRKNDSVNIPAVWGHKGDFGQWTLTEDGKYILDYTVFGEKMFFDNQGTLSTLGVIAHEFGHDLKLPDLYNTTYNGLGLGYGSLMAWGGNNNLPGEYNGETPTGFSAYSKQLLGLPVETVDISKEDQIYTVKTITNDSDNPTVLRINTDNPKEYFLIENRQFEGFDKGMYRPQIYSGGIAIYKVNTAFSGNHSVGKQMVTLLEAEQNIVGYSKMDAYEPWFGDPFYYVGTGRNKQPQATMVNGSTNPSTKLVDGSIPDFSIEVLDAPASTMRVKISKNRSVESIAFDYESKELEVGQTFDAIPTFTPKNATNQAVSWKTSDKSLASVDANGTITALKEGKVTITATTQDGQKTADFQLTVVRAKITIEDIIVEQQIHVPLNEEVVIPVTLVPGNAYKEDLIWTVSDSSIAVVDANGTLSGKKYGQTKLTISTTDGKIAKEVIILVGDDHGNSGIAPTLLEVGQKTHFRTDYLNDYDCFSFTAPEEGYYAIKVTTTNKVNDQVAGLWMNGATWTNDEQTEFWSVGKYKAGETNRKNIATSASHTQCPPIGTEGDIEVVKLPGNVEITATATELRLNEGESKPSPISVEVPKELPGAYLTFTSRNPEVATVDSQGNVTAKAKGQTWIDVASKFHPYNRTTITITVGDDHGNSGTAATLLNVGQKTHFRTDYLNDYDCFSFTAPEEGYYAIKVTTTNKVNNQVAGLWMNGATWTNDEQTEFWSVGKYAAGETNRKNIATLASHTQCPPIGTEGDIEVVKLPGTVEITATAKELRLNEGESQAAPISVEVPKELPEAYLTFTSRNPEVATVDSQGNVTAKAKGQTWIDIVSKFNPANRIIITITVGDDHGNSGTAATLLEIGQKIPFRTDYLNDYDCFSFTAPEEGYYAVKVTTTNKVNNQVAGLWMNGATWTNDAKTEFWSIGKYAAGETNRKNIATSASHTQCPPIGTEGDIEVVKLPGTVEITATAKELRLTEGESQPFPMTVDIPEELPTAGLIFTSSNPEIASVDSQGNVFAQSTGQTYIDVISKFNPTKRFIITVTIA